MSLVFAALLCWTGSAAFGALPASDNAGNYNGSGQPSYGDGANAGVGFQPFSLFAYNSSGNFLADYNPGNSAINSPGGKVFDVYAQYGGFAGITRRFTANDNSGPGSLAVGDTVSFRLDIANTINNDGGIGFTVGSGNNQEVNFGVNGADGTNQFSGAYGTLNGIDLNTLSGGVAFSITVDSARQFTVTARGVTNPAVSGAYTFTTDNDLDLTELTIYNYNSGPGNDLYFNDLAITAVPEPATCLAGIGCAALLILHTLRRRAA